MNGSTLTEDAYTRRDPRIINWGESTEIPMTSQTSWSSVGETVAITEPTYVPFTTPYFGNRQMAGGAGAYMYPETVPIQTVGMSQNMTVYLSFADGHYTRILREDGASKYIPGDVTQTFDGQWDSYWNTGGPYSLV